MGFISQILSVKVHGTESAHEKVTQIIKSGKNLLEILDQEIEYENKVKEAEAKRNSQEVIKLQKEEILLISKALADLKHLFVEVIALTEEERNEIDKYIIESKKLQSEGMDQGEEGRIMDQLQQKKNEISEIFASTRATSGFER
jgi:hypothetical protein